MNVASGYCRRCERMVKIVRQDTVPNGAAHAILTLCTCGVWGVVWGLAMLGVALQPWRCDGCGARAKRSWFQ